MLKKLSDMKIDLMNQIWKRRERKSDTINDYRNLQLDHHY